MTKTLTVIELEDWSLLFSDETLVHQDHSTHVDNLVTAAKGEPVILARINAHGSSLDKKVSEAGDVSMGLTLSEAAPLAKRQRG